MASFNPSQQVEYTRDIDRCHFGTSPTLEIVRRGFGRRTAESWLQIQLNNLSDFAGCRDKLSTGQVQEMAGMIMATYPHFKLTEFMLFFQRFKRCDYGRFYGSVDPMVIMQSLAMFSIERSRAIREHNERKESQRKEADDREDSLLRQRYAARVPEAFTPQAPLSFLQYRLLGYDRMTDEELAAELAAIGRGDKTIPTAVSEMLRSA